MALNLKKVGCTSNYLQGSLPNEMRAMRTYTSFKNGRECSPDFRQNAHLHPTHESVGRRA